MSGILHSLNKALGSGGYPATDRRSNPAYLQAWTRARKIGAVGPDDTPDAAALGMAVKAKQKASTTNALAAQLAGRRAKTAASQSKFRHREGG